MFGADENTVNSLELNNYLRTNSEILTKEYRFPTNSSDIIEQLFPDISPTLNSQINNITILDEGVQVNNTVFDFLILACSPNAIQNTISFSPKLPQKTEEALSNLSLQKGTKLSFVVENSFWGEYPKYLLGSESASYFYFHQGNEKGYRTFDAFLLGDLFKIENIEAKKIEILKEVARLYDVNYEEFELIDSNSYDWGAQETIGGFFSAPITNGTIYRNELRHSIYERIYFSGEAYNTKNRYGTIEGAMEDAFEKTQALITKILTL